jgi:hypothetical protein
MKAIHELGFRTAVSYEPALEPVNWQGWEFLDWLICGGESGNQARPMPSKCERSAREFCVQQGIPYFFKQWGEWLPVAEALDLGMKTFKQQPIDYQGEMMVKVGTGMAGHLIGGVVEWRDMPKGGKIL